MPLPPRRRWLRPNTLGVACTLRTRKSLPSGGALRSLGVQAIVNSPCAGTSASMCCFRHDADECVGARHRCSTWHAWHHIAWAAGRPREQGALIVLQLAVQCHGTLLTPPGIYFQMSVASRRGTAAAPWPQCKTCTPRSARRRGYIHSSRRWKVRFKLRAISHHSCNRSLRTH